MSEHVSAYLTTRFRQKSRSWLASGRSALAIHRAHLQRVTRGMYDDWVRWGYPCDVRLVAADVAAYRRAYRAEHGLDELETRVLNSEATAIFQRAMAR